MSAELRKALETIRSWTYSDGPLQAERTHTCGCIGPQDGNPVCPCRMSALTVKDGRWVEVIDHGPAPTPSHDEGQTR